MFPKMSTVKGALIATAVTFGAIYLGTRLFPRAAGFVLWPGGPYLTNPMNLIGAPSTTLGLNVPGLGGGAASAGSSNRDPDAAYMA